MTVWLLIGLLAWVVITVVAVALGRAAKLGDRQARQARRISPYGPVQKWGHKK